MLSEVGLKVVIAQRGFAMMQRKLVITLSQGNQLFNERTSSDAIE